MCCSASSPSLLRTRIEGAKYNPDSSSNFIPFVCVDVDAEAQQLARVEEKKAETRRRKNEKKAQSMQWEAMKPVMPTMETETEEGSGGDETMDLDDAIRNTRRTGRRLQGGKLLGCRVKTTKKQREKQKKKLKRSKR